MIDSILDKLLVHYFIFSANQLAGGLPTRKFGWISIFSANRLVWWPPHSEMRVEFDFFGQPACLVAFPLGNSGGIQFFRPTSLLVASPLGNSSGISFFWPTSLSGGLTTWKFRWVLIFSANQFTWWPFFYQLSGTQFV